MNRGAEQQLSSLRDYCRDQGWEVHAEYMEQASGMDMANRADLERLLEDARQGKFGAVVVVWPDRVAGLEGELTEILDTLEALGIGFYNFR